MDRYVQADSAYEIWSGIVGERKEQQVQIEIAITTRNRIIKKARSDIINHTYIQALDVWELIETGGKNNRRTRVVNVYNNYLCPD